MSRLLLAASVALVMATGVAVAQTTTTTSQSTTTSTPAADTPLIAAPPVGTLTTTHTEKTIAPDGTQTEKTVTTYRNTDGVADDSLTTTTTVAPRAAQTTTWSSSSTTVTVQPPLPHSCPPHNKYDAVTESCVTQ